MKRDCVHRLDSKKERKVKVIKATNLKKEKMSREEIMEKLTSIHMVDNGKVCVYTRRIPSFIYPFALGRKEGFADTLRIYITEERVCEELNGYLHREVTGKEAEEWRKWAKMQKEGVEK